MTSIRRIMHVDMDAFYASVEQADNPDLKGRPVIVGAANRGVVTAASYEARRFGVHSAMPVFKAKKLCPHALFIPVRMERYREVSRQLMEILAGYSPVIEAVSIDEAYLDISGMEGVYGPEKALAQRIKSDICRGTCLTCSVGIAHNKLLAKIASDLNKPDGLTIVGEDEVSGLLRFLPIRKIPGIGEKTRRTLEELGVSVASDILRFPAAFWKRRLGRNGVRLLEKAQGIDDSPVLPWVEPKSCSAEDTFPRDITGVAELEPWIMRQAEAVGRELRRDGHRGRTITVKAKFSDFSVRTKSCTLSEPTACTQIIYETARSLLTEVAGNRPVRLTGVGMSNLVTGMRQARLFPESRVSRLEKVDQAMDQIEQKFGKKSILRGRLLVD